MLSLKRRKGTSVYLKLPDGRIGRIVVIEAQGSYAQLAFDFPDDVRIEREASNLKSPSTRKALADAERDGASPRREPKFVEPLRGVGTHPRTCHPAPQMHEMASEAPTGVED